MSMASEKRPAALHPEARALLDQMRESGAPPYEAMTVAQARETSSRFTSVVGFAPVPVGSVEDVSIGAADGAAIMARLYRPDRSDAAPAPGLVFLHGGGWVVGSLDSHDAICRRLCAALSCPLLSVDYRLAPEHPFPAAAEDAMAAVRWLHAHAAELGVDPERIAVAGDSAGGALAAVAAIAARDGLVPPLAYQLLLYPVTDLLEESASYARVTEGMPVTAATMRWFRDHYLAQPGDAADWRASPLRATSLAGVAPALVVTMEHDPLCDEGRAYAQRLADEGVEVSHLHLSQHVHGLISMGALLRDAEMLLQTSIAALRAALWTARAGSRS